MLKHDYATHGITLNPTVPSFGDKVKVVYDGLLVKSGASEVFAHVGFGNNWTNSFDYKMSKSGNVFETTIPVTSHEQLNICFKDAANNWDNNAGLNYVYPTVE